MLGEWFAQFMSAPKYPPLVDMTEEVRTATLEDRVAEGVQPTYSHYVNGQKQD
jgi:hypothetical protein